MVSGALRPGPGAKSQTRNASSYYFKIIEGVWCAAIRGCVRAEHSRRNLKQQRARPSKGKTHTFPRRRAPKPKGIEQFKRNT